MNDFNTYEIIFHNKSLTWHLNGRKIIRKHIDQTYPTSDTNNFSFDLDDFDYYLVMTMNVDKEKYHSDGNIKQCHSFIIDHVRISNFVPESDDYQDDYNYKSGNVCNELELQEKESYIKFVPRKDLKLVFHDDFNGTELDDKMWLIKNEENKCSGIVYLRIFYLYSFCTDFAIEKVELFI